MILKPYAFNNVSLTNDAVASTSPSTDYDAYFPREFANLQMPTTPGYIKRAGAVPLYSGKDFQPVTLPLCITITHDFTTVFESLNQLFDTKDETPRQFICVDTEDSYKQYYVYATAKSVQQDGEGGPNTTVMLALDDPIWQSVTQNSQTWSTTTTTSTTDITNAGNDYTFPIFEITPTSGSTDYAFSAPLQIVPTSSNPWPNRFLDITGSTDTTWDTAALVAGGKMQADGRDLRVFRDGAEVDRWLNGINTTDTHVIVSCDMPPRWWFQIKTALTTDTVTEIEIIDNSTARDAVSAMPNTGRLLVYTFGGTGSPTTDAEEFVYSAKTLTATKIAFTIPNNARAQRGTVALAHAAGSTAQHLPFDFTLVYGSSSTDERTMDDTKKPIVDLTSRNSSFTYTNFWEIGGTRPNIWYKTQRQVSNPSLSRSGVYTSTNDAGDTDPATALGVKAQTYENFGTWNPDNVYLGWYGYFPDYITSVSASGAQNQSVASIPTLALQSYSVATGYINLWTIAAQPSTDYTTWTTWTKASSDATVQSSASHLQFLQSGAILGSTDYYAKAEISSLTVGLTNYPDVQIRAEAANYKLSCRITNDTTGEFIDLLLPMELNATVYVDTDPDFPTVTSRDRILNTSAFTSTIRAAWLKLNPGVNTLSFQNNLPAANDITIVVKWRDRMNFL
jgi:hypothetical protein